MGKCSLSLPCGGKHQDQDGHVKSNAQTPIELQVQYGRKEVFVLEEGRSYPTTKLGAVGPHFHEEGHAAHTRMHHWTGHTPARARKACR